MGITFRSEYSLLAVCALVALTSSNALAAMHPAYLHALTDLRTARAHLEARPDHGVLRAEERAAVEEIGAAIEEIKRAAIEDGKNINWHPPVDLPRDWSSRLHRSMELLNRAYHDVDGIEDNRYAQGLRSRALGHISRARQHVHEAIEIVRSR